MQKLKFLFWGKRALKKKMHTMQKEWIEKSQPIVIFKDHKQLKG